MPTPTGRTAATPIGGLARTPTVRRRGDAPDFEPHGLPTTASTAPMDHSPNRSSALACRVDTGPAGPAAPRLRAVCFAAAHVAAGSAAPGARAGRNPAPIAWKFAAPAAL